MCNVVGIFVQGQMPVMWNTSAPGHIIDCNSSYEVYTDIVVWYVHIK